MTQGLPIFEELRPAPSAWSVFNRLRCLDGVVFFDSAMRHPKLGRYSFVAADPFETLTLVSGPDEDPYGRDPFTMLRRRIADHPAESVPGLPPFQGGAAGLFSYDLCRYLERLPAQGRSTFQYPEMVVGLYDWVVAFDHSEGRAWVISHGFPEDDVTSQRRRARQRIEMVLDLLRPNSSTGISVDPPTEETRCEPDDIAELHDRTVPVDVREGLRSNFTKGDYLTAVERAIDAVYAGDIFQVNLSQQLYFPARISSVELYRRLRECNPSTFAAYFSPVGQPFQVASASPERFLKVTRDGIVETRPIKGTRPRGQLAEQDRFSRDELRESAKDRSENVMIVDLLRNDLSRVCRPGSVIVPNLFGVETYPSIHHLVSVVEGRLLESADALDLLMAAFPGGSITGAPKIRAQEIIADLEPDTRGPYCGSLGYIGFDGSMDTSILIRTVTTTRGWLQFPVGGGIVADSSPKREYEETLHKARGILWALT